MDLAARRPASIASITVALPVMMSPIIPRQPPHMPVPSIMPGVQTDDRVEVFLAGHLGDRPHHRRPLESGYCDLSCRDVSLDRTGANLLPRRVITVIQVSPPVHSIGLLGGIREWPHGARSPLSGQAPRGSKWFPRPKPKASDDTLGTFNVGTNPLGVAFDGANIWVANAVANGTVSKM